VQDGADLYRLKERRDDLLKLERLGEKSVDNLLASIEASKQRPLAQVIVALGIRHVGGEVAQTLATHFGSIDALMEASVEQITGVPGIGTIIAESVREFFSLEENRAIVEKLRAAGVNLREEGGAAREGPLSGLSFVVTGRLDRFSRDAAESLIKRHGGAVVGSISKKTDYLVVGAEPGSKLQKAQQFGTTILDEEAFAALLHSHGIEI
jgi:DNA ligase (NAD+)